MSCISPFYYYLLSTGSLSLCSPLDLCQMVLHRKEGGGRRGREGGEELKGGLKEDIEGGRDGGKKGGGQELKGGVAMPYFLD